MNIKKIILHKVTLPIDLQVHNINVLMHSCSIIIVVTWQCGFCHAMTSVFAWQWVRKASACHHTLYANHCHCLWKIPPIIAVKNNVTTFIQVLRFVANMFYCGGIAFTIFKHADIKGASRAQRPLTTGIVRRQFPSLRGTTWLNIGGSAWNGSPFEHIYVPFTWRLLTFTGWKLKCHVIIMIDTDLSGFVVPMHSGLCEQYVKSPGPTPWWFDFLLRMCPHALGHQPLQNQS